MIGYKGSASKIDRTFLISEAMKTKKYGFGTEESLMEETYHKIEGSSVEMFR